MKKLLSLAVVEMVAMLLPGCVGYKNEAPLWSWQRGPETFYNQPGSGVQSRTTNGNQQQAKTTAPQLQLENVATADNASNMEATRTVGLKQGVAQDKAVAQGRDDVNSSQQSTGKSTTGHTGSDSIGIPAEAAGAATGTTTPALTAEKAAAAAALLEKAAALTPSTCPDCNGNGVLGDGKACPKCGGKGTVQIPTATVTPAEPAVPASTPATP
jgi:hypothetical protein